MQRYDFTPETREAVLQTVHGDGMAVVQEYMIDIVDGVYGSCYFMAAEAPPVMENAAETALKMLGWEGYDEPD